MAYLLVLKESQNWEKAIKRGLELIKQGETELLVMDEAVTRCIRCEPELFRYLHQFILDGGKALVCCQSLTKYGIPETRPPEAFIRLEEGQALISEKKKAGWQIEEF